MANKKISELPTATAPDGSELVEIVQGGINKQATVQDLADLTPDGWLVTGTTVLTGATTINGSGNSLDINTAAGALSIQNTSAGLFLSSGSLLLTDINSHLIELTNSGIQIASQANIDIHSDADLDIEVTGDIKINLDPGTSGEVLTSQGAGSPPVWGPGGTNTAVAITDASSMDITGPKHTLTTSSATRTFTQSWGGDFTSIVVTLNTTASTFTFPAGALCVSDGIASGDNTLALAGVSGDKYYISISKFSTAYYVVSKNFGQ